GVWKGIGVDGEVVYEDKYSQGRLASGRWKNKDSQVGYNRLFTGPDYKYTNNHIIHRYLESINFYQQYVSKLKPKATVWGDYYVTVTVLVNGNGKVVDVNFTQSAMTENVKNTLNNAILNMPNWKPAKLRGVPISSIYRCSIPF